MWSFATDPEFQKELDWISTFVSNEVEPLDFVLGSQWDIHAPGFKKLVRPLQAEVKKRGLWACHLGQELGGKGYGQLKLALMNEQFGRSRFGPIVFGSQAPDTGNSEILAHYGTPEQKKRYLEPLLANDIVSCFSITEPQGGADPNVFVCRAEPDGNGWVLNGEKWFASNAKFADFFIFMAVTDPDAPLYERMSMFIADARTPGIEIVKNYGFHGEPEHTHAHIKLENVRLEGDAMFGARGKAFEVAQVRLGGGRMHHAMRTIAEAGKLFDMMCERVLSRVTQGEVLANKQMVQEKIADSWTEMRQFRLLVLETAWLADQGHSWKDLRKNVAAVKAVMPKLLHDIAARALHLHGSLGISDDAPFVAELVNSFHVGLADGPTEVHKVTVARQVLRDYSAADKALPDYLISRKRAEAVEKFRPTLEELGLI